MRTVFNKLVRDRIPEIITADDAVPMTRVLNNEEFVEALFEKLREETEETITAKNSSEIKKEIADVLEVLRALAQTHSLAWEDIEKVRVDRAQKRGGFEKRIFLEATEQK